MHVDTELEQEQNDAAIQTSLLLIQGLRHNGDINKQTEDRVVANFNNNLKDLEKKLDAEYKKELEVVYTDLSAKNKVTSMCWTNKSMIWNRTRPRAVMQNQPTRELISAWKMSYKHSNKDLSCLWYSHLACLVFTRMPGESCHRQLSSLLLCLYDVFWVLINFFVDCKKASSFSSKWEMQWPQLKRDPERFRDFLGGCGGVLLVGIVQNKGKWKMMVVEGALIRTIHLLSLGVLLCSFDIDLDWCPSIHC